MSWFILALSFFLLATPSRPQLRPSPPDLSPGSRVPGPAEAPAAWGGPLSCGTQGCRTPPFPGSLCGGIPLAALGPEPSPGWRGPPSPWPPPPPAPPPSGATPAQSAASSPASPQDSGKPQRRPFLASSSSQQAASRPPPKLDPCWLLQLLKSLCVQIEQSLLQP